MTIEMTRQPSELYADTVAIVVGCPCGWRVTRYSDAAATRSANLHEARHQREDQSSDDGLAHGVAVVAVVGEG